MSYELEIIITVAVSCAFLGLAMFLGVFVDERFGLFVIGFPIPQLVYAIRHNDPF